jgi:hypothetical protein
MVGGILSDGSIPHFAAVPDLEEHPHRPASAIPIIGDQQAAVSIEQERVRAMGRHSVRHPIIAIDQILRTW